MACYTGCVPPVLAPGEVVAPTTTPTTLPIHHGLAQSLPFTGADIIELLCIGFVLLVLGYALIRSRRT